MSSVAPPGPARVVALDVVRGLAVLGMFTAHLGDDRPGTASGWLVVFDGRSAATFALLAGVGAALIDGGAVPRTGQDHRHSVARVLARAAVLWPLGLLLTALGTPVDVILTNYAVMLAVVTLALRWPRPALLVVAVAVATVGPLVWVTVRDRLGPGADASPPLDAVVGQHYPAVVWTAYLLVGVAIGRTDLRRAALAPRLLLTGTVLAAVAYGSGTLVHDALPSQATLRRALTSVDAHANTTPEVVGNIGVTLALLGAALLLVRVARPLLVPLAATGALALTAYSAQLVVIAALGVDVVLAPSNLRLAAFVGITLVATTAWWLGVGRGPLERGLHALSTAVADLVVGRRSDAEEPAAAPR